MIMCTFQTLKINMIILFAKGVLASFEGISFEGIFTDNFISALLLKPFQSPLRNGACRSVSPAKLRVPCLFARSQREPTHVASFDSRLKC